MTNRTKPLSRRIGILATTVSLSITGIIASAHGAEATVGDTLASRVFPQNFNHATCQSSRLMTLANTTGATGSVYIGMQSVSGHGRVSHLIESPRSDSHTFVAPWGGSGHGFAAGVGHRRVTSGNTVCFL